MKFGVVVFPGSNCDQDIISVLENMPGTRVEKLWHKEQDLKGVDFVILPGGFSYGDYLRSGAIASLSPIMRAVIRFGQKGGYILGICNGFQVLTESRLLPGALLHNTNQKFVCKNVHITPLSRRAVLTAGIADENRAYKIPIAHAEGRYFAPAEVLDSLAENDQILFKYTNAPATKNTDSETEITQEANPNGSAGDIAGVCNKNGNIMGMMPHPERAASPILGNTDGLLILQKMLAQIGG